MSKKRRKWDVLHDFDPASEKLAIERFLSGKQVYDYRNHHLKPFLRDALQARAVLVRAQQIAHDHGKELILSYLEKKLLARAFTVVSRRDGQEPPSAERDPSE
jgi:hypothetical protein